MDKRPIESEPCALNLQQAYRIQRKTSLLPYHSYRDRLLAREEILLEKLSNFTLRRQENNSLIA